MNNRKHRREDLKRSKQWLIPLLILFFCHTNANGQPVQERLYQSALVEVSSGLLQGINDPVSGQKYFLGVPFAQPPVGKLRWREPQPPAKWDGIRPATDFGPKPMQNVNLFDMEFRSKEMSEDCLYLNIWTPAKTQEEMLPVLVYFYGGGFVGGDGSEWRYDGTGMAQKGIVVVTVNYRLGVFGFFSHPELTAESPYHGSGNYGFLDQYAGLKWVKQNIKNFGGNPDQITIGGESAGSISVFAQMASPLSKSLITGAIGESGALINPSLPPISLHEGENRGEAFAKKAGAESLAQLRNMDATRLLELASKEELAYFSSTIDGYFFPEDPVDIFIKGNQAPIPLLVGWNSAEIPYSFLMRGKPVTTGNYEAAIQSAFGENAADILKAYPGKNENQIISSATALSSNQFIVYSTWKWAELHRQQEGSNVYQYIFEKQRPRKNSGSDSLFHQTTPPPLKGAGHSWEIEYALGNLTRTNKFYNWTPDDYKVSATMLDYFANFVKHGNPNGGSLPDWPANSGNNKVKIMHINVESQLLPETDRNQFEVLDKIYMKK